MKDLSLRKEFEELLNTEYGEVEIAGYSYPAGYALRELDPVAFEESFRNHADSMESDDE